MVRAVGEAAGEHWRMPLYFVGGPVRDLLLQIASRPIWIWSLKAMLLPWSTHCRHRFGGEVHTHARFGTAKWFVTPADLARRAAKRPRRRRRGELERDLDYDDLPASIDFVTARSEFYTEPSALPEVERGSIKLDLHRRDFTINTLAVRLDGAHLGELLDFYGGRRDLERGSDSRLAQPQLCGRSDAHPARRALRAAPRLCHRSSARWNLLMVICPCLSRVTGAAHPP